MTPYDPLGLPAGAESLDPTLLSLIEGLKLGGSATAAAVRAACAWCEEEGYLSPAELMELGSDQEFVSALGLKPKKAQLLLKRIAELPPADAGKV